MQWCVYMRVMEETEGMKCEYSSRTVWQPVTPALWILNLSKCHFEEVHGWISASLHLFSLLFFFSSMLPLIQEIGQKVSLEAFAFSTNPQFLHDGVKEILFSSNFFDKLHFFFFSEGIFSRSLFWWSLFLQLSSSKCFIELQMSWRLQLLSEDLLTVGNNNAKCSWLGAEVLRLWITTLCVLFKHFLISFWLYTLLIFFCQKQLFC